MDFNIFKIMATLSALIGKIGNSADEYVKKVDSVAEQITNKFSLVPGMSGESSIEKIVGIAMAIFVVAVIFPPALDQLASATIPDSMAVVGTLLKTLLPILAIIGIVLYIYSDSDV